ncbi:conjugative transposon protein TraM [Salinimicrobium catena]|uniref:conjugative transposon protein TraM n=1 Tax=Salinimicrobium catena TaxID=390640 RepID=UPI002FE481E7
MKIDKKKIVFASILLILLIFIVSYSILVFFSEDELQKLDQPVVPELKEEETSYTSKLNAIDALKEEREKQIPSIYSEALLDSMGVYDPALEEKEREWVIDSIYRSRYLEVNDGDSIYAEETFTEGPPPENDSIAPKELNAQDLAIGHKTFFLSGTVAEESLVETGLQPENVLVVVSGDQTVRTNDRLELRLMEKVEIGGRELAKHTRVFGFVTLQPNRVQIKITHIQNFPVELRAFDLQDSNEGIYVENSIRDEARRKVLDDVVQDINIGGLPQLSGIKNIFRKNNRNVKVTVMDQYQLLLKP